MRSVHHLRPLLPLAMALLALAGAAGAAEDPVVARLASFPGREQYPQARAIILEKAETIDCTDPWRCVSRERLLVKLLDQKGVEAWGFIKRRFDAESESLRIVTCRTIGPDGSVLALPANAANVVTADEAAETPEYGNYHVMVITPLGLCPGAVVELELERVRDSDTSDAIAGERIWQGTDPALRQSLTLTVPRGRTLLRWRSSKQVREKFTNDRDVVRWEWRVDSLPGIPPEDDRPDDAALSPRLLYTDRMDWRRAAGEFARKFLPAAADTAKLSGLAATITAGDSTVPGKVGAVARYLNDKIRLVDIGFGDDGYQAAPPAKVLANRYADDKDRAALFLALLAACGVKAAPVLCWEGDEDLVREIPDLARLDRILLAVEQPGAPWLIDPANNDRMPGFVGGCAGKRGLLVKARDVSWIDIPPRSPDDSRMSFTGRLRCQKKLWRADGTIALSGRYDQEWRSSRRQQTPPEREKRVAQSFQAWAKQASVTSFTATDENDIARPVALSFGCDLKGFAQDQGEMTIIKVPDQPFWSIGLLPWNDAGQRRLPQVTSGPLTKELRWRIDLPAGYRPASLPDSADLDNEAGSLRFRAAADDSAVTFESRIVLKRRLVPPEQAAQLTQLMDRYSAPANWYLLLVKKK
ncbi:MAG TPA: DUF3857 domain-containing protein [Candidatus Edwardsbacteria bacterium]|nr:DUF3857 domain-containing protein [Candidatus Edwardsbacteria bacterium]